MSNRARVIGGVVLAIATVTALIIWLRGPAGSGALVVSGTVEATEADLGFQVAGRIERVLVREGDRVRQGQLLAVLISKEIAARRNAAEAQAGAARARLRELTTGFREEDIAQAEAALKAAEYRRDNATADHRRATALFQGGAISRREFDARETAYEVAVAEAERAAQALRLLQRGPRPEQVSAGEAAFRQAEANLSQADALLDYVRVEAPFAGVVTDRNREPGEVVAAGAPVVTIMNPDDRWVRVYVPETSLGRIELGQPADITSDSYPDRTYRGEVMFIADEAEFTPRNVQTTEERVKLVYQVRIRVLADSAMELKPGLPADVTLRNES